MKYNVHDSTVVFSTVSQEQMLVGLKGIKVSIITQPSVLKKNQSPHIPLCSDRQTDSGKRSCILVPLFQDDTHFNGEILPIQNGTPARQSTFQRRPQECDSESAAQSDKSRSGENLAVVAHCDR